MSAALPPRSNAVRRMMVKHREGVRLVDPEDILMIQREERATAILLRDGSKLLTAEALGEIEKRLPSELFFRAHRSYIINLEQIDSIMPYGRWTHIVRLRGTQADALITHEKFEELERRFQ